LLEPFGVKRSVGSEINYVFENMTNGAGTTPGGHPTSLFATRTLKRDKKRVTIITLISSPGQEKVFLEYIAIENLED
jgi:hypothetical protein